MTGFGDLTVQGDVEIKDVSQVSAWVTDRMVCLSLSKDGSGRRQEFSWCTLTHVLTRHPHGDGGAGLGVASMEM